MTWVRLDDKFHRNQKQRAMSDHAFRVFVLALSYCGDTAELTGFMTTEEAHGFVRSHGKKPFVIDELVRRGFLEVVNGGYLIHDFEHYIPKTSTERVRAWREKKRSEGVSETLQKRSTRVSSLARAQRVPEPVPVPVPVSPLSVGSPKPAVYGIPETSMHVEGPTPLAGILGTLHRQPEPRKEAI